MSLQKLSRAIPLQVINLLNFSELVERSTCAPSTRTVSVFRDHTLDLEGNASEVITLEFDKHMILHVPTREAHLLTRYLGLTKKQPKLASIGSGQWIKTRTNAEHATA